MNREQRQIYYQAHMLDECFVNESIFDGKKYDSIDELKLFLDLYPTHKEEIIQKAGKKFKLNGKDTWFIVAEDGECAVFNNDGMIEDLKKIKTLYPSMMPKNITKINIPANVNKLAANVFANAHLKSIVIPDTVKNIGLNAFWNCTQLQSVVLPRKILRIAQNTFYLCRSLTDIELPPNIKEISSYAFAACELLQHIDIPDSVKEIGVLTFGWCHSLKHISIGHGVDHIGTNAFAVCEDLQKVIFKGKTLVQVQAMKYYPWGIKDASIIRCEA